MKANLIYSIIAIVSMVLALVVGAGIIEIALVVAWIGFCWKMDFLELGRKENESIK